MSFFCSELIFEKDVDCEVHDLTSGKVIEIPVPELMTLYNEEKERLGIDPKKKKTSDHFYDDDF